MRKLPGYFKKIAGPAAVMAAASMGAGSASSLILTGAWFRYELLWVVLLILPLLVITVDTASDGGLRLVSQMIQLAVSVALTVRYMLAINT